MENADREVTVRYPNRESERNEPAIDRLMTDDRWHHAPDFVLAFFHSLYPG